MSTYLSEFEPIEKKVIRDYHDKQNIEVLSAKSRIDETVGVVILFSNPGIFRSRPALQAVVETAINAIWYATYHELFGAEAVSAMPSTIFEEE